MGNWRFGAIVMAAGSSARLGRPKALVVYRGKTLLARTIAAARSAGCDPVLVVVRADLGAIAAEAQACGAITVVNPQAHQGLASSIRVGIHDLVRCAPGVSGVLMLVADQPRIAPEIVDAICAQFDGAPGRIVAAAYAGTRGVPALFARLHFDALTQLQGDQGARSLIAAHAPAVVEVAWPNGAQDMDDPRTLRNLESEDDENQWPESFQ